MDALLLAVLLALAPPAELPAPIDFDGDARADRSELDSPWLQEQVLLAMAMPYRYGVTQMPCKARIGQPLMGWYPAREPSGRIRWLRGSPIRVKWAGIYGTCTIQAPWPREAMGGIERAALECECNGWLPDPVTDIPLP